LGEIPEFKSSDPNSDEAKGWMSDGGRHFADLPIFSFGQIQTDPAVGNGFTDTDGGISGGNRRLGIEEPGMTGKCLMIADRNSLGEFF
jgi:hypothetical protein